MIEDVVALADQQWLAKVPDIELVVRVAMQPAPGFEVEAARRRDAAWLDSRQADFARARRGMRE